MARTIATNRKALADLGTHSLIFDGVNDEVSRTTLSELGIAEMQTVCVVFKTPDPLLVTTQALVSNSSGASNRNGIMIKNDGFLYAGHYNGTSYIRKASSDIPLAPNKLYTAIYISDGTTLKLYLNGVEQSGTDSPFLSANAGFVLGGATDSSKLFLGTMSSVKVFNTNLSAKQVSDLYFDGIVPRDNLVAEYFRDPNTDGAGAVLKDSSESRNNGAITGATWSTDVPRKARSSVASRSSASGRTTV